MEDLGQTQSSKWRPDHNSNERGGGGTRERKIVVLEEEDQLRWGGENGGEFNLKEAWYYIADQDQEDLVKQWGNIWCSPQWPKIKMFEWLVLHNQILTWENLRKMGYIGPSRCHLCQAKEEKTNHLLDE
jgi:hypothetical protein